jgi:hypothetical protein
MMIGVHRRTIPASVTTAPHHQRRADPVRLVAETLTFAN